MSSTSARRPRADRHRPPFVHEGSLHGFEQVRERGARLARPDLTFGFADHYVPTRPESARGAPEAHEMVERFAANVAAFGVEAFGVGDVRRGIAHVAAPEQGLDLAGPDDRLRRQPYLHAWRLRRLRVRHRRLGSRACADDPDALADPAEAHARRCGRRAVSRRRRQGYRAYAHRARSARMALRVKRSNMRARRSAHSTWQGG